MSDSNVVRTSITIPTTLWNRIQNAISRDDMTFSRWVQNSSRHYLRIIESRNVKEFVASLDEDQKKLLKQELGL